MTDDMTELLEDVKEKLDEDDDGTNPVINLVFEPTTTGSGKAAIDLHVQGRSNESLEDVVHIFDERLEKLLRIGGWFDEVDGNSLDEVA
jgi:hypothetical protein